MLLRADVGRLPFATESLSAIHAGAAIHCWPDPSQAVRLAGLEQCMPVEVVEAEAHTAAYQSAVMAAHLCHPFCMAAAA